MSNGVPIYVAVVDDDESQCRSFGRLLRASGMQPVTYASVQDFLADTKHPRFDCLVLDIQFEGISGIELQRRLAAVGSRTPVVFLTAQDEPEVQQEALAAGGAAFFSQDGTRCGGHSRHSRRDRRGRRFAFFKPQTLIS